MTALPKQKIAVRPDSAARVSDISAKLIRKAEAEGVLPTPIGRLFEIARVTNVEELPDEAFLKTLSDQTKGFFRSAMQKLRGIADLREKTVYIPPDSRPGRELFVKAHELGHQVLPWHSVDSAYMDDNETLSPAAKAIFEQEANFFGSETIFQGPRFRTLARDFQPDFAAIFHLADRHGASRQATAWRFVEEQDEALALLQYYPTSAIDEHGNRVLNLWVSVGSPRFNKQYGAINAPITIRTGHAWVAARDLDQICDGNETLIVDDRGVVFQWHAWWNKHALLVLLRRRPPLRLVGRWLRS
jgi:hypothetical protein